jgi:hypothetical protein
VIFLIDYDRTAGTVVRLSPFSDADRTRAEEARLTLELHLNRAGIAREVVLLEAPTEEALKLTHRRYFENLADMVKSSVTSTG